MEDIHWWSVLCTVVSQVWGILGQIVALLSSLSTKWNQLPDENKNNQTSFIGHESLPCQACWDRWRSFWHLAWSPCPSSCRLRPARSLHWMEPNLLLLKSHLCLPSLKRKALPSSSYTSPPEDPLTLPSPASLPPLDPVFCLLDPVFCLLDPVFCLLDPIFCLLSPRSYPLSFVS